MLKKSLKVGEKGANTDAKGIKDLRPRNIFPHRTTMKKMRGTASGCNFEPWHKKMRLRVVYRNKIGEIFCTTNRNLATLKRIKRTVVTFSAWEI